MALDANSASSAFFFASWCVCAVDYACLVNIHATAFLWTYVLRLLAYVAWSGVGDYHQESATSKNLRAAYTGIIGCVAFLMHVVMPFISEAALLTSVWLFFLSNIFWCVQVCQAAQGCQWFEKKGTYRNYALTLTMQSGVIAVTSTGMYLAPGIMHSLQSIFIAGFALPAGMILFLGAVAVVLLVIAWFQDEHPANPRPLKGCCK